MEVAAARLRLADTTAAGRPLFGAAMRAGRADVARRARRTVTSVDGLEWTVRRLRVPPAMLPHPPSEMVNLSHPQHEVTGALPLGFLLLPVAALCFPFVLVLRALRLLPWTIEARAYPWGKRTPPVVFEYQVRGRDESVRVLDDLVAALERGDGGLTIAGAERIR